MENISIIKKSRFFVYSLLILLFSMVLLLVTALGTSLAWFTGTAELELGGNTATVQLKVLNGITEINSGTNISLTNTQNTPINVQNTSNVDVYIRAFITCNWENNSNSFADISSCVTINFNSNWYAPTGRSMIGNFIYYKGAISSAVANATKELISSITISSIPTGAGSAVINVWAEAVQANSAGESAFATSDSGLTVSAWKATFPAV